MQNAEMIFGFFSFRGVREFWHHADIDDLCATVYENR